MNLKQSRIVLVVPSLDRFFECGTAQSEPTPQGVGRTRVCSTRRFDRGRALGSLIVGTLILAGCDNKNESPSKPSTAALSPLLPTGFFLAKEPPGAKPVEEIKKAVKAGDTVTIQGLIGGSVEPFVEGRAVFTLMGSGLHHCAEKGSPMPDCPTPWDYCCDPPKDIAAHSATVQVVDAASAPLKLSLKGQNGVKELSNLVVVGKVSQAEGALLVINATGAFVRHD